MGVLQVLASSRMVERADRDMASQETQVLPKAL